MKANHNILATHSKNWITEALLILMDKREFKKITIVEIAKVAGVDRKTFYRNFDSKEDVLKYYLDTLCQEFIIELNNQNAVTTHSITKTYFMVCSKHIPFLKKLEKQDLMMFFLLILDDYLPQIHERLGLNSSPDSPYADYASSYHRGGFWNITVKWIKEGAGKTPEEMADIIEVLLSKPLWNEYPI